MATTVNITRDLQSDILRNTSRLFRAYKFLLTSHFWEESGIKGRKQQLEYAKDVFWLLAERYKAPREVFEPACELVTSRLMRWETVSEQRVVISERYYGPTHDSTFLPASITISGFRQLPILRPSNLKAALTDDHELLRTYIDKMETKIAELNKDITAIKKYLSNTKNLSQVAREWPDLMTVVPTHIRSQQGDRKARQVRVELDSLASSDFREKIDCQIGECLVYDSLEEGCKKYPLNFTY